MNRREFILSSGAGALYIFLPSALFAANSTIETKIRFPLITLDGIVKMLLLSEAQFDRAVSAAMYSLTQTSTSADKMTAEIKRLSLDGDLRVKGIIGQLEQQIGGAKGLAASIGEEVATGRRLEGEISRSADAAIWMAALAARRVKDAAKEIEGITLDPTTLRGISQSVMLSIGDAVERKNFPISKVAISDVFREAIPIDVNATVSDLLATVPVRAGEIVRTLIKSGLTDVKAVEDAFAGGIKDVLNHAQEQYSVASQTIKTGESLIKVLQTEAYQSAVEQVHAVGALAAFVFGNLLGDQKTAKTISTGLQFASVAFNLGMTFATGGLGALGMVGGLMSGLGSLGDLIGGGSGGSATTSMLQQISGQLENLRSEMHARFDRLEELQTKALNMLTEIAKELKETRLVLSEKIDQLNTEVAQLDRYIKSADRHEQLAKFDELASLARIAVADRKQIDHITLFKTMSGLLQYAIDGATHPAFTSTATSTPLRELIVGADRIDLTVGLWQPACQRLGIQNTPSLSRNPLEWARGVNAYVELQSCFEDVRNDEIDRLSKDAWLAGVQLRTDIQKTLNSSVLEKAIAKFQSHVSDHGAKIAATIRKAVLQDTDRKLTVGWYERTPPIKKTGDLSPLGPSSSIYIEKRSMHGPYLRVDGDPLLIGLTDGRLKLVEQSSEELHESIKAGGIAVDAHWGTLTHYRLSTQGGRDLGEIGKIRSTFASQGDFWDLSMRADAQPEALWGEIDPEVFEVDLSPEILAFLQDPDSWKKCIDVELSDEMTAAIMLLVCAVSWSISDEPDDPWRSAAASLMPRNYEEIRALLIELTRGASERELSILSGVPAPAQKAIHDSLLSPIVAKPFAVGSESDDSGDEDNQERYANWHELRIHLDYERVVAATLDKWYGDALTSLQNLSPHLKNGSSVPLVDRTLLKLNGLRTFAT